MGVCNRHIAERGICDGGCGVIEPVCVQYSGTVTRDYTGVD